MPFTLAHPAAVLPFARPLARWRLLSAAVIGSMTPDFGWFSPWRPARFETHGADALLTFCLPVGLATYWIFQRVIRTPIIELLPPGAYGRWRESVSPADYANLKQWIFAALGVLGGAITHLIWDAFTHEGARGLRLIPSLEDRALDFGNFHLYGAHLLQDANSLAGLIVVFAVLAYGLRPARGDQPAVARRLTARERWLWIAGFAVVTAALSLAFYFLRHPALPAIVGLVVPVNATAVAMLRGLAAAVIVTSVCLNSRLRMSPR
jgi:Domain of unknown function (DUF4184)